MIVVMINLATSGHVVTIEMILDNKIYLSINISMASIRSDQTSTMMCYITNLLFVKLTSFSMVSMKIICYPDYV